MIRLALAAILLALLAPGRLAAAQDRTEESIHPYNDPVIIEHFVSGTIRIFNVAGAADPDPGNTIATYIVILDDQAAAERFVEDLTGYLTAGDEVKLEPIPFRPDGLPEQNTEAILYQTVPPDPATPPVTTELGIAIGLGAGAIRLGNTIFYSESTTFDGAPAGKLIIPLFEAFVANAATANADDPATYLPTEAQLPEEYAQNGDDKPLHLDDED